MHSARWWANWTDGPHLGAKSIQATKEEFKTSYEKAKQGGRPFINIITIGDEFSAVQRSISFKFPTFPGHLLRSLSEAKYWGRGSAVLPSLSKDGKNLSFLINYVSASEANQASGISASVKFTPVLVWICWGLDDIHVDSTFYNRSNSETPIIFILTPEEDVLTKLSRHFRENDRRLERLQEFPEWIFLDLDVLLSKWTDTWSLARQELVARNMDVNSRWNKSELFNLTRVLHLDIANIIALKEDLRLQKSATLRYQKLLVRIHGQPSLPFMSPSSTTKRFNDISGESLNSELRERLEDHVYDIGHQQETSDVILKQFENLLSLAFNIETVSQGQVVARLNFLAIAFLPLSFVASIFGMTRFNISAAWYPLGAMIVLVPVVAVFLVFQRFSDRHTMRSHFSNVLGSQMPEPHEPMSSDVEAAKEAFDITKDKGEKTSKSPMAHPTTWIRSSISAGGPHNASLERLPQSESKPVLPVAYYAASSASLASSMCSPEARVVISGGGV